MAACHSSTLQLVTRAGNEPSRIFNMIFQVYLLCLNRFLNVKAVVAAFNQEGPSP